MKKNSTVKVNANNYMDTISPATKLLEKRRQLYEVHEAFEAQKEHYKSEEAKLKQDEDSIRARDLQIQEQLIKLCKHLQDNENKKKRAEARYQEEHELKRKKEDEISALNEELKELHKNSKKSEAKVKGLKAYEEYLEYVLRTYPDQYNDLSSISQRHARLHKSQLGLDTQYNKVVRDIGRLKDEITQYEKDKNREMIQLGTEVAILQEEIERIESKKNTTENIVHSANEMISSENLSLGRILMAIDNIFSRCEDGIKYIKEDPSKPKENEKREEKKKEDAKKDKAGKTNKGEPPSVDEADDFNKKYAKAGEKLRKIGIMMTDFKTVISECAKEVGQKK